MRFRTLWPCAFAVITAGCAASRSHVSSDRHNPSGTTRTSIDESYRSSVEIRTSPVPRWSALSVDEEAQLDEAGRRVAASVVHVRTVVRPPAEGTAGSGSLASTLAGFGGSGFCFAADGLIVTTEHVLRDATSVTVVLPDGTEQPARRLVADDRFDLAVLKIDSASLPWLVAAQAAQRAGDLVVAVAGPNPRLTGLRRGGSITRTGLSLQEDLGPDGRHDYGELLESTAPVEAGFSGGPVTNRDGLLVGIVVAAAGSADGGPARGYALPLSDDVSATLARLIAEIEAAP